MGRPVARWLRRSALRTDSPALLVPGSCGATRFARCARFAQTQRRKSDVRSALRAPTPGLRCSAPQKARNRAPHRLRSGPGRSAGQMHRPFPPFAGLPPLAAMAPTLVIDAKTAVVPANADRLPHVVSTHDNTAYTSCTLPLRAATLVAHAATLHAKVRAGAIRAVRHSAWGRGPARWRRCVRRRAAQRRGRRAKRASYI